MWQEKKKLTESEEMTGCLDFSTIYDVYIYDAFIYDAGIYNACMYDTCMPGVYVYINNSANK